MLTTADLQATLGWNLRLLLSELVVHLHAIHFWTNRKPPTSSVRVTTEGKVSGLVVNEAGRMMLIHEVGRI